MDSLTHQTETLLHLHQHHDADNKYSKPIKFKDGSYLKVV